MTDAEKKLKERRFQDAKETASMFQLFAVFATILFLFPTIPVLADTYGAWTLMVSIPLGTLAVVALLCVSWRYRKTARLIEDEVVYVHELPPPDDSY